MTYTALRKNIIQRKCKEKTMARSGVLQQMKLRWRRKKIRSTIASQCYALWTYPPNLYMVFVECEMH